MNHLSEDDLVLLYYADGDQYQIRELENHIAACGDCRQEFERIGSMLGSIDIAVPEPAEDYGREVWRKLQPFMPTQTSRQAANRPSALLWSEPARPSRSPLSGNDPLPLTDAPGSQMPPRARGSFVGSESRLVR